MQITQIIFPQAASGNTTQTSVSHVQIKCPVHQKNQRFASDMKSLYDEVLLFYLCFFSIYSMLDHTFQIFNELGLIGY